MNKTIKFFATAAGLVFLASCSQKVDFTSQDFVRFNSSAYNTKEDDGTVKIPVYAYSKDGATVSIPRAESANTSVTFDVIDRNAVKGTDYTISPANGVLSFDGSSTAYIEVSIIEHPGVYTGSLSFDIVLTGAGEGYKLASEGVTATTITIKDNDHPLANFIGNYTSVKISDYWGDEYVLQCNVEAVDGDPTALTISNLCPNSASSGYTHKFLGVMSADHKTFTVTSNQWIVENALLFFACNVAGSSLQKLPALVFDVDEKNHTLTTRSGYAAQSANGFYDLIPNGGVVLTRQ